MNEVVLDSLDRRLLNEFQQGLPLDPAPFAAIAQQLGVSEAQVLERLRTLQDRGVVSRVGAVFDTHRIGASTLAAMSVPPERLEQVAGLVSSYTEVNHNYEREHAFNLWFVVTAPHEARLAEVLEEIESRTGIEVIDLPMLEDFHIDLGFDLQWR